MVAATHIPQAAFLHWPETKALLAALAEAGIDARFVGGCVRDALLGREAVDVDLASATAPEDALHQLQALGIKVIPTGIEHGTITIVIQGKPFELTTLRHDVDCDGRHAIVAYTDSWEEDAKRRDFTINALYADASGAIYDYTDGQADLKRGTLRFIGDGEKRIKEDALRMLRLFRFQAQLGFSVDASLYALCKKHARMLSKISAERISQEIMKLLAAKQPQAAWQALFDYGVAEKCFGALLSPDLEHVMRVETQLKRAPLPAHHRLILLAHLASDPDVEVLKDTLKLSNQQAKQLSQVLTSTQQIEADASINQQRKWHYLLKTETFELCIIAAATQHPDSNLETFARMLNDAQHWTPPIFPIGGEDLIARGHTPGKAMGEALRTLEAKWMISGFELSKEALLSESF